MKLLGESEVCIGVPPDPVLALLERRVKRKEERVAHDCGVVVHVVCSEESAELQNLLHFEQ